MLVTQIVFHLLLPSGPTTQKSFRTRFFIIFEKFSVREFLRDFISSRLLLFSVSSTFKECESTRYTLHIGALNWALSEHPGILVDAPDEPRLSQYCDAVGSVGENTVIY